MKASLNFTRHVEMTPSFTVSHNKDNCVHGDQHCNIYFEISFKMMDQDRPNTSVITFCKKCNLMFCTCIPLSFSYLCLISCS